MKSKTIILSSPQSEHSGRGILSIYEEDDLLKCKLRLYNAPNLSRYCKLGIYHQKEVYSANLLEKSGVYFSSLVGDFNIDKDFYVAIIDTENNNNVLLAGGTYAGYFYNDQSNVFSNINKEDPNTNLYDYSQEFEISTKSQPNTLNAFHSLDTTDENSLRECHSECSEAESKDLKTEEDKCAHCKYKEYFYSCKQEDISTNLNSDTLNSLHSLGTTDENNLRTCHSECSEAESKNLITKENTQTILSALIPQFDYVFDNYEADETLNNLIPNSKFVKICENQEQYSLGAIYEEDKMRYICYAVLKDYNIPAPQELGKHYQWLPLDKEDPLSDGYYIVFQDASDLKIVEL